MKKVPINDNGQIAQTILGREHDPFPRGAFFVLAIGGEAIGVPLAARAARGVHGQNLLDQAHARSRVRASWRRRRAASL